MPGLGLKGEQGNCFFLSLFVCVLRFTEKDKIYFYLSSPRSFSVCLNDAPLICREAIAKLELSSYVYHCCSSSTPSLCVCTTITYYVHVCLRSAAAAFLFPLGMEATTHSVTQSVSLVAMHAG